MDMDTNAPHPRVTVGKKGQIVIPAEYRQALGIEPGAELIVSVENRCLVLVQPETLLDELQHWFDSVPADVSLVDELIAERRAEALRDLEEIRGYRERAPD